MSKDFTHTVAAVALLAVAILVLHVMANVRDGRAYTRHQTAVTLRQVASASRSFREVYGAWPACLPDLTNNPRRLLFLSSDHADGRRYPVLYRPYAVRDGFGAVINLGRDGKPGGRGMAADMEFRFSASNVWRHQHSVGGRPPPVDSHTP